MRFAFFAAAVVLLASAPASAQDITGPARVIDGDTIATKRALAAKVDAEGEAQTE